jgi:hypothetical protein
VTKEASGITEVFPLLENQVDVRQAHLAWLAAKEKAEMEATVDYVTSVNGSTKVLISIMNDFQHSAEMIPALNTHSDLDTEMQTFREIADKFHRETSLQMTTALGRPEDLRQVVQTSVRNSVEAKSFENQYWHIRQSAEIAIFDLRLERTQNSLNTLREQGYEISAAQEKLTEITTMRTDLATVLRNRNDAGIEQAHKKIHTASIEYVQAVRDIKRTTTQNTHLHYLLEQGEGVMTRSGMVNADLKSIGITTNQPEKFVTLGNTQIATAQNQINAGDTPGAKATVSEFRETVKDLRDAYREILVTEDLPRLTAQGVLSVAQSLDITATRMGAI